MYDDRTNLGQQVGADIREFFGTSVFATVIPRNIRLGEAPSHGLPVILYDACSRGAEAYLALAHEFMRRATPPRQHGARHRPMTRSTRRPYGRTNVPRWAAD